MKDGCKLLIKIIVFIEHFNVKEILLHGLYNSWKTFLLVYRPGTVHPLCHDAPYESCGASWRAPRAFQHPPVTPTNREQCCLSYTLCYKNVVFLPTEPRFEEDFSYHLGWLSVTVRALLSSKAPFSNAPKLCRNSVLTTKLSLTGHGSAARQCRTSFWFVLCSLF